MNVIVHNVKNINNFLNFFIIISIIYHIDLHLEVFIICKSPGE